MSYRQSWIRLLNLVAQSLTVFDRISVSSLKKVDLMAWMRSLPRMLATVTSPVSFFEKTAFSKITDDVKRACVFVLFALVSYLSVGFLIKAAISSGVFWDILRPAIVKYENQHIQTQLFDASKLTRKWEKLGMQEQKSVSPLTLVVGDADFLKRFGRLSEAEKIISITMPNASLPNVVAVIQGAKNWKINKYIIQNAPWYWSNMSPYAYSPFPDMKMYKRVNGGSSGINADLRLALGYFKKAIKKIKKPFDITQKKRPVSFLNLVFDYPSNRKLHHFNNLKRLLQNREVLWVSAPEQLPNDASSLFGAAWKAEFPKGSIVKNLGRFQTLDEFHNSKWLR